MEQHELRAPRGATKARKRIGRGAGSGTGTYAGKGMKGQQARSGYKTRPAFEGGQTALVRRLPRRRGFRNPFRIEYEPVNLADLARLPEGNDVTPETLVAAGIVKSLRRSIKILGDGEVSSKLTVRAHRVSAPARAKIEAAGGTVEEMTPRIEPSRETSKKRRHRKREAPSGKPEKPAEASSKPDEQEQDDIDTEASEGSEGADAE